MFIFCSVGSHSKVLTFPDGWPVRSMKWVTLRLAGKQARSCVGSAVEVETGERGRGGRITGSSFITEPLCVNRRESSFDPDEANPKWATGTLTLSSTGRPASPVPHSHHTRPLPQSPKTTVAGQFVVEELATVVKSGGGRYTWAVGGRSAGKLAAVLKSAGAALGQSHWVSEAEEKEGGRQGRT